MSCSQGAGFRQSRLNLEEGGTCFGLEINPETETLNNSKWPGCFFLLWPLFARDPRHWFLENFLLSAPGVQNVFCFVALRWAPRPFGGARAKKNTTQGFFFFCSGPGERQGKEKPRWAPARGQSKKKKTPPRVFFFLLRPRRKAREGEAPFGAGTGPEQKKKHHPGCFLFCSGPGERQGKEKPRWAPGCFFFFFAAAPPGPGWCFFFLLWPRPDAHSLTVGWGDFGKARVVFFFCCGPAGSF